MKLVELNTTDSEIPFAADLTESKLLYLLKTNAKNAHEAAKRRPIFTTVDGVSQASLLTPSRSPTSSLLWAERLVSGMTNWNRFPSYGKKVTGIINGDGDHALIPLDGVRVGVAAKDLFANSFVKLQELGLESVSNQELSKWVGWLTAACQLNEEHPTVPEKLINFTQFMQAMNSIWEFIEQHRTDLKKVDHQNTMTADENHVLNDMLKSSANSVETYLKIKFDPEANGFITVSSNAVNNYDDNRYVWISGPVIAIDRSYYTNLVDRGLIK